MISFSTLANRQMIRDKLHNTLKDFVDFQKKDIIEVYNSTVTERTI